MEVTVGGHGHGLSASDGSMATAPSALSGPSAGPGITDIDMDHNTNDDDDDNYKDITSSGVEDDNNDDDDRAALETGDTVSEDKNSRHGQHICSVVCTNQDYGLGEMVHVPDTNLCTPAIFEAVELQAPTFFASRLLVCAGGYCVEEPTICLKCLC
jgi:hypothetical protein